MKKASGRLTMSMQPRRELEGKPVTRLMDVQDNTGRGDGETVRKVMTTFQMDADLKAELNQQIQRDFFCLPGLGSEKPRCILLRMYLASLINEV